MILRGGIPWTHNRSRTERELRPGRFSTGGGRVVHRLVASLCRSANFLMVKAFGCRPVMTYPDPNPARRGRWRRAAVRAVHAAERRACGGIAGKLRERASRAPSKPTAGTVRCRLPAGGGSHERTRLGK